MGRLGSGLGLALALALSGCGGDSPTVAPSPTPTAVPTPTPTPTPTPAPPVTGVTQSSAIVTVAKPWAIKALPDGRLLVTQRTDPGVLSIVSATGAILKVGGLPTNIGMLDVQLAPDFAVSHTLYFSYMVGDPAAPRIGRAKDVPSLIPERMTVAKATLSESGGTANLVNEAEIFRQVPAITTYDGSGEPGGRIAFSPDGRYVFITSGDRQEVDTTVLQHLDSNIGAVVRLFADGSVPTDNPFYFTAGARPEIWTYGHRNPYGLAFAPDGLLWSSEMGPLGGDELNVVLRGQNYGWPLVSNGDDYSGAVIPDHAPGDGFEAPKFSWTPVIAPAGMLFYKGQEFGDWRGDILLTGLKSDGLVRVRVAGNTAQEVQRIGLGTRIRDIAEGADGSLWVITDGAAGELRKLTPVF